MMYALGERRPVLEGNGHFIAPDAAVIGSVSLGDSASVWFNTILRGDNDWLRIGARSNVQDSSVLHTDPGLELVVGDGVTIGHKVLLHGCSIGDNVLVGIGSNILNRARIGANSIVGAHALVTEGKAFPEGSLILGAPASVKRELTDDEIAMISEFADIYVENARRFSASLEPL